MNMSKYDFMFLIFSILTELTIEQIKIIRTTIETN